MSDQPERCSLAISAALAGLILAGLAVACSSPLPSEPIRAAPSVEPPPVVQQPGLPSPLAPPCAEADAPDAPGASSALTTTAVLFLLDESGGVSGHCEEESGLRVVDRQGVRFEIVRFLLTVMGIQHEGEPSGGSLQLGVMRFAANRPERLLGLTPVRSLLSDRESLEVVSQLSVDSPLSPTLDPCHTDYPRAISDATRALTETAAANRVLVLLTDGSFRGWTREDARAEDETEQALREATDEGVVVYVVLLGGSSCADEECEEDLTWWTAKGADVQPDGDRLIRVLDAQEPFAALRDIRELEPYWPPGVQWVDEAGTAELLLHDYADSVQVWTVYYGAVGASPAPQLLVPEVGRLVLARPAQWPQVTGAYEFSGTYPVHDRRAACGQQVWTLQAPPGAVGLAWAVERVATHRIEEVSASPVLLSASASSSLDAHVVVADERVTQGGLDRLGSCYRVEFLLCDGSGVRRLDEEETALAAFSLTQPFTLAADVHPQTLTLGARIWLAPEGEERRLLDEEWTVVTATYLAQLGQVSVVPSREGELGAGDIVTVTVPITHGSNRYVPGAFPPTFYLECTPEPGELSPRCYNQVLSPTLPFGQREAANGVTLYTLELRWEQHWEPGCGCRYLHISWRGFEAGCRLALGPERVECETTADLQATPPSDVSSQTTTGTRCPSKRGGLVFALALGVPVAVVVARRVRRRWPSGGTGVT